MPRELTDEQGGALDEMMVEAGKLATMADNFGETIRLKGHESVADAMVNQAGMVRRLMARLPQPSAAWDGKLYDEHLVMERFWPESRRGMDEPPGVRLKHTITGIGRESYSKPTYEENRVVARRALEEAVLKEYRRMYA